ncbi:MAG: GNAT family N-acetyltransferase [Bacteroidetes bacterium]|nr:GNAT family N-acetyltransferase [Bacteroidota bacterium]
MKNHLLFPNTYITLLESEHIQQLTEYYTRNINYHKEWSPFPPPKFFTAEFQQEKFTTYKVLHNVGIEYRFVILAEELIIGTISLNAIERGVFQNGRFGYSMDENYAGKGIMTSAIQSIIRFAFSELGLHRLEANIMPRNISSRRVLEKCGFQKFGFSPQYLRINNTWEDHDNYMILSE